MKSNRGVSLRALLVLARVAGTHGIEETLQELVTEKTQNTGNAGAMGHLLHKANFILLFKRWHCEIFDLFSSSGK